MNAVTQISFASAYRQLQPAEKLYVDAYVREMEDVADRERTRISNLLHRPVSAQTVENSRGLLQKPMVVAAITERVNEIAINSELTVGKVLREYAAMAFASMGDYMEIDGNGQPWFTIDKCTPEQLSAIKKIKIDEKPRGGRTFELELHDKQNSLNKLAAYMGMLDPDNPYWKADNAKPAAVPLGNGETAAAEYYSGLIDV